MIHDKKETTKLTNYRKIMIHLKEILKMSEKILQANNPYFESQKQVDESHFFTKDHLKEVSRFHKSIPVYEETPVHSLKNLASHLGVQNIFVKDEGQRFGLKAFKGLGASFAVAKQLAKMHNLELAEITFDELMEAVKDSEPATFTTATAGNHGKGFAWATQLFNQKTKVFMPKGSSSERVKAVRSYGAEVEVTSMNYDDTVSHAAKVAEDNDWILVQDTAWEGYMDIPMDIMQGYTSIITELTTQLDEVPLEDFTHVVLQAGVGSFAAAMVQTIKALTGENTPKLVVVEPRKADPLFKSAQSKDGAPTRVYSDLDSMMAGLACGEPNPSAWNILRNEITSFFSCEEIISAKGMRVLGNTIGNDTKIISGESGAVSLGFIYEILSNEDYLKIQNDLELNEDSNVLVINTEGDTDPKNYRRVVWDAE